MNKLDLEKKLIEAKINSNTYWLEGGLPNEAYCLNQEGFYWEVYYSERGNKTGLKRFHNQSDACNYLLLILLK